MDYATWNPSDKHAAIVLSNGNLTATNSVSGYRSVRSTLGISSGKWYLGEFTVDAGNDQLLGIGLATAALDIAVGMDSNGWSYGSYYGKKYHDGTSLAYGATWSSLDRIAIAYDADAGKLWFSKNGVWQNSGDPEAGTGEAYSGLSGEFFVMYSPIDSSTQITANFGASAFIDSVPSGFNSGLYSDVDRVIEDGFGLSEDLTISWYKEVLESLDLEELWIPECDNDQLFSQVVYNQAVSEVLNMAGAVDLQQILKDLITDGLGISIEILLDDELWECWVLNTEHFHPSVYSGFDFNSYAVFDNVVYGARADGIHELVGDDDNGQSYHTGIVLPETRFGIASRKKFRRAYLGISGSQPSIKVETESGSKIFLVKNAKVTISRDLIGRCWTIKVADFDTLDFIHLIPLVLAH